MIANILGLASTMVLARLLLPEDFGLVALGTTLLAIVTTITDVPLTEALIQHKNPLDDHFHTAFSINASRSLIIAFLFCALAWPVAIAYKDHRLLYVMPVLAAGIALNGFGNPRAIMLTKDMIFWQQFMLQVAQKFTAFVVSVAIAIIWRSYWALLLGNLAGQLIGVIVSYTVLPFRPKITFGRTRELMSFSIWLTLCQILNTINWRLDQFLIGTFLGKPQLGYYVVGDNVAVIPTREATAPLTTTLFPAFTKFANDRPRLASAYTAAQALTTAVALPLGVGLALIAAPLIELTMGQRWHPVIFIIQIIAPVYAFQMLGNLAQPLAMANGQTPMLFRRDIQAFAFRVPFIILGMYLDGLPGIIYARLFVGTTSVLFNINIVTRITGLTFIQQMTPNFRAFASTAGMAAVDIELAFLFPHTENLLMNMEEILVLMSVGAVTYVGLMAIQWYIAGRPSGPEAEVISVFVNAKKYLKRYSNA